MSGEKKGAKNSVLEEHELAVRDLDNVFPNRPHPLKKPLNRANK